MNSPRKHRGWFVWALLLLAGTLVACGGRTEAVPEPKAPESVQPALADTSWNLTSLQGNEVLPGTMVTAVFGQYNTLTGSAGCNEYSTSYQVDGSSISIGSVVTTKMSCPEPEGIMVQENAYLAILENLATYRIQGDQLDLSSVDGELVATFAASSPVPLEGTPWRLYAYNDEQGAVLDPLPGTEITATFGEGSELAGSAGCNDYTATYTVDGDSLTIGPVRSTLMACAEPEGVLQQETAFLGLLESAASYEILASRLKLSNADGEGILVFIAADSDP